MDEIEIKLEYLEPKSTTIKGREYKLSEDCSIAFLRTLPGYEDVEKIEFDVQIEEDYLTVCQTDHYKNTKHALDAWLRVLDRRRRKLERKIAICMEKIKTLSL